MRSVLGVWRVRPRRNPALCLTWLISLAENWMALLPTGLGSGGKRSCRALGGCQKWGVNGGKRGKEAAQQGHGAAFTSFCSAGR